MPVGHIAVPAWGSWHATSPAGEGGTGAETKINKLIMVAALCQEYRITSGRQ